MILTDDQKQRIIEECNSWGVHGKHGSDMKNLDAFYTPPELAIQMIEQFDSIENKTILDPTCGSGNLLAACIIAGANPKLIYGNELDVEALAICKKRLIPMGVPESNLHLGNALDEECLKKESFDPNYKKQTITVNQLW